MKHRLFNSSISYEPLEKFIKDNFVKEQNYYYIDELLFKKLKYQEKISSFIDQVKSNYHASKSFYCDNINSYKQFLTVLRQHLKYFNMKYTSKIKYANCTYNIFYFIYIE